MPQKVVDLGRTRLVWVATPPQDPSNPTVQELEDGVDLTCLMVTSYEVRADTSDTVNEKAVCDRNNVVTVTAGNFMGSFVLFRQWDDAAEAWDVDIDPSHLFPEAGLLGHFYRREGPEYEVPWTADQEIEGFRFMTDNPQFAGGTDQGYQKATVPLHQQGWMDQSATVAANP